MLKSRRFWLGFSVSALFLALFLLRVDFSEARRSLASANYLFILPGVALYFLALLFRTWRWRYLLHPMGSVPVGRLWRVMAVGYMANNLLPVRLGELVRSYYLRRREGISTAAALATVVVERVFDGLALLFLLAMAAIFLPVSGLVSQLSESARMPVWLLATLAVAPFLLAIVLLWWMSLYPQAFLGLVYRVTGPLPRKVRDRLHALAGLFVEGLKVLRQPRQLMAVFLLSVPVWLFEGAMYYTIALGFNLQSEMGSVALLGAAMLAVTATSNMATSLPSSQGGVGPFEFFARETLVFLGVGIGVASAYVVVLHVALLAPVTVLGLAYLWMENLSLGGLLRPEKGRPVTARPDGENAIARKEER